MLLFEPQTTQFQRCVNISVIDDEILENTEFFSVLLDSFEENTAISVNLSTVSVLDNDGMLALLCWYTFLCIIVAPNFFSIT